MDTGAVPDKLFLLQRLFCPCMILRRRSLSLSGDSAAAAAGDDADVDVDEVDGDETRGRVAGDVPLLKPSLGRDDEGL